MAINSSMGPGFAWSFLSHEPKVDLAAQKKRRGQTFLWSNTRASGAALRFYVLTRRPARHSAPGT